MVTGNWGAVMVAGRLFPCRDWTLYIQAGTEPCTSGLFGWEGSFQYEYSGAAKFLMRKRPVKLVMVGQGWDRDYTYSGKAYICNQGCVGLMTFQGTGQLWRDEALVEGWYRKKRSG